ncbi:hypothetical protein SAMN05720473_11062 [Fibrobacter sp. UWB15]|nr:hypothetical protein BGW99_11062 [Fibrobacter sp. UWB6]SHG45472.1 hypothetical protein SAMN05720760_11162 [Fibrobacter sp. UWB8]SMG39726.1 hypothetical protein SAMN05720473_11062 [Fibrobacter sp. UWB15]
MEKKLKSCIVCVKKWLNETAKIRKAIGQLINIFKLAKLISEYWPIIHALINQFINN